jgi:toxin ParE1/3/4
MSLNTIIYRQKALEDITEIVKYLAFDNLNIAKTFRERLEETVALIAHFPELGSQRHFKHPDLANVRFVPMKQFKKHLIFYQVFDNSLHIIRIVQGTRNLPTLFR